MSELKTEVKPLTKAVLQRKPAKKDHVQHTRGRERKHRHRGQRSSTTAYARPVCKTTLGSIVAKTYDAFPLVMRPKNWGELTKTLREQYESEEDKAVKARALLLRSLRSMLMSPGIVYRMRLSTFASQASSVAGIINVVYSFDPSATVGSGLSEWSTVAGLFDEFRVVEVVLDARPTNRYSKVTTLTTSLAIAGDNDSAAVVGSYNRVFEYNKCSHESLDDPWKFSYRRPNILPDSYWVDVGSPSSSHGSLVIYADALSSSVVYYDYVLFFEIEFRGRQ